MKFLNKNIPRRACIPVLDLFIIIFLFVVHLYSLSSSAMLTNKTDQLALLAFKKDVTEDPEQVLTSWNNSLHFCEWPGVTCSHRRQRVIVLDLQSRKFGGRLSPFLGNLSFLQVLNLGGNNFRGEIPPGIGNLFWLRYLFLNENSLGGGVPANLSHCSELRVLHLNFNKLTGRIPEELSSLPKLAALHIAANNLTGGIPPVLGNISSLLNLSLARNNLGGNIPEDLSRLSALSFFQVGANNLSGIIPPSLFNLSRITIFAVADNQLTGTLPESLGTNFPNLQILAVGVNQFSGRIPSSLSNASGLQQIDFPDNHFFGGMPNDIGILKGLRSLNVGRNMLGNKEEASNLNFLNSLINCSKMELLGIDSNQFSGELPTSIANFSINLRTMLIGDNRISGTIPAGIVNLINLSSLYLQQNLFSGQIPQEIGKLSSLRRLLMNGNRLSGNIPLSIGNITELFELRLDGNILEGSIPAILGNCQHLQVLNLSHNKLSGNIPKEVIGLPSLSISLNLAENVLSGNLPVEVGNLINLKELDLSENKLTGNIPSTLGNCLTLEQLSINGNFFEGEIPSSFNALKGLQDLDLSRNNLSGTISEFLQDIVHLKHLNLSFNNFEGEVPRKGVFSNISASSLSGNSKLCGGISHLKLPACPTQEPEEEETSVSIKVIIVITVSSISGFSLLVCILTILVLKRLRRKTCFTSPMVERWHSGISYKDLHKATDGFSQANLIGAGSFASVYKGILNDSTQHIAVKVLNLEQREATKTYMAEYEALRNIRHRNLVKILNSCSSIDIRGNEFRALILEFMSNGSLDKWLHQDTSENNQQKLTCVQMLNVAIDVSSALEYLHYHCHTPIIHCDLKPSNVLLDSDLCAHISDFGLSKFLTECTDFCLWNESSSIGLRGSIGYVAPGMPPFCSKLQHLVTSTALASCC